MVGDFLHVFWGGAEGARTFEAPLCAYLVFALVRLQIRCQVRYCYFLAGSDFSNSVDVVGEGIGIEIVSRIWTTIVIEATCFW